jgi:hypothetical protein
MNLTGLNITAWWVPAFFLGAAAPLCAEESRVGVSLPGLEADPAGSVIPQSCAVSVMGGKVTVDLSASTTSDRPALMLNGALFGWSGPRVPYPERHFPELEIRIDGEPAPFDDRFDAFAGKMNITYLLKLAQMDPWAITRTPPLAGSHPKNAQALKVLKNVGAIERSDDDYIAKWTARRLLRIPLNAGPEQRVELNYTARPDSAVMTVEQLDTTSREKSYCVSPKQLKRLTHSASSPVWLAVDEFIIPTGIDGKAPASVILTMSSSAAGDGKSSAYLLLCGPHGRPIARRGAVSRERAEVDDGGILRVLSMVRTARP